MVRPLAEGINHTEPDRPKQLVISCELTQNVTHIRMCETSSFLLFEKKCHKHVFVHCQTGSSHFMLE